MKNTAKIIYVLVFLIIGSVVVFFLMNCFIKVPEDSFTVFMDNKTGDTKVYSPGAHCVLQGLIPGRVKLQSFKKLNNEVLNIKLDIFSLEPLKNDALSVRMSLYVSYLIDINEVKISKTLFEKDDVFKEIITDNIKMEVKSELYPYISPAYNPDLIKKDSNKIIENAFNRLNKNGGGFNFRKLELRGPVELPSKEIFLNELKYISELEDIEKNNKKELLILQTKLLNEQKINSNYYAKLHEISKLIKENPDLLKYIYIDKMADNVKIILSSDKSGLPLGLADENKPEKDSVNNGIDSLK